MRVIHCGVSCAKVVQILGTPSSDKNVYRKPITRDEFISMFGCKPDSPRAMDLNRVLVNEIDEYTYWESYKEACASFISNTKRRKRIV
jgi:hypothetical protein